MRRSASLALAAAVAPGVAEAHAFGSYDSAYQNFLEGAAVFLTAPRLVLPVLAVAVALALWQRDGLLKAWGLVLAATLLGQGLALVTGPWIAMVPLGLGLAVAALAALVPLARLGPAVPALAGMTLLAVTLASLEGHGWGEVALATRVGLLFATHLALAAAAGAVRVSRDRFPHRATDILWRVFASWLAAILVLYLAFALRSA